MAGGVYGALAGGIESGFSMGRQAAQDEETKRARKVVEDRQAGEDRRATEEHGLRLERQRFALDSDRDEATRKVDTRMEAALDGEITEIEKVQAARQAQGLGVDPTAAARYAELKTGKAAIRQRALDYWSRAKVGQINPMDAPGPELRMHMTAATGMLPEDLPMVRAGAADIEAGLETQNWGLVTQGANKAMVGLLKRGVGGTSPYGGTVTRKEIIGLDPAVDAAGNEHPNRFIPRVRVYVDGVDPTGKELFYDAPMTRGGTSEADDKVVAIDIKKGMDWLGNAKMLADIAERPDVKAKLAENDGGAAKRYIDELNAVTAPKPKFHTVAAGARLAAEYPDGSVEIVAEATPKGETPLQEAQRKRIEAEIAGKLPKRGAGPAPAGGAAAAAAAGSSPALGGATAPGRPEDAVEFWARAVIAGDRDWQIGLARSKSGSSLIEAVKRRVPVLAKELGLEAQDIGTTRAQNAAMAATLKDLTKRAEAVDLFASKVEKDMKTYEAELAKPSTWNTPEGLNTPINVLRRKFSSPELARLDLAARQVGTEYERLITGGTLSVAQLHVGAQEEAKKLINGDMPPAKAREVMAVMRIEIQNARDAAHESTARITDRMRNLGRGTGPAAGPAPQPGMPAPAGAVPAAAPAGGMPVRPPGVPPDAKYSPSRKEWWLNGQRVG